MVVGLELRRKQARRPALGRGLRASAYGLCVMAFSVASGPASACAFDMVKPERTQIDWIVESEKLVLARPDDENPFAFDVTRILVGEDEGPPISQLVDSMTRRKLATDTSETVLFAHNSDIGWRRVAYVDESYRNILDTALEYRVTWQTGMPQSRLDFVTALQNSSVPTHKAIVIGELDKVPYADLRALDLRIPSEELLRDLWARNGYPYQAIRALLLGLSGTPSARAEIHDYINRASDRIWADNLGAFAAAFIELEGVAGVEHLASRMLLDPKQPLEKLEQVVMAMSVHHGLDNPELQEAIQIAIHDLINQRPEAGVIVARQFSLRSDWSQSAILEPLVRERKIATLGDLLTVSVYLAKSREEAAIADGERNE